MMRLRLATTGLLFAFASASACSAPVPIPGDEDESSGDGSASKESADGDGSGEDSKGASASADDTGDTQTEADDTADTEDPTEDGETTEGDDATDTDTGETGGEESTTGDETGDPCEDIGDKDGDGVCDDVDVCPDHWGTDNSPDACACDLTEANCVGGSADGHDCENFDIVSQISSRDLGAGNLNDNWGWIDTDPELGKGAEYAIIGGGSAAAFVDMRYPACPRPLGILPKVSSDSIWRDMKVYKEWAYIVSEDDGGVQVFNMTKLRGAATDGSKVWDADTVLRIGHIHNVVVNEDLERMDADPENHAPYMYVVLSGECGGGLSIYDIKGDKAGNPEQIGCWSEERVHDAHCLTYYGPDSEHEGKSICLTANDRGKSMSVVDVDDPSNTVTLATDGYEKAAYSHQGWVTEDYKFYIHGDEADDDSSGTKTYMWNIEDLDNVVYLGRFSAEGGAIDHNQYVVGDYIYQSNYGDGLQVLDITKVADGELSRYGFFATNGSSWSNFPFFLKEHRSQTVLVNGGSNFFILRHSRESQ